MKQSESAARIQMSVVPSLGGEKRRHLLLPALPPSIYIFFFYLCEQSICTQPTPHPSTLPLTLSGRKHMSTRGSRKLAERRWMNGDALSDSISSFQETLPSCLLYFFFYFGCCFAAPPRTFIPPQRLHRRNQAAVDLASAARPRRSISL